MTHLNDTMPNTNHARICVDWDKKTWMLMKQLAEKEKLPTIIDKKNNNGTI